jgi:hypothetical protein
VPIREKQIALELAKSRQLVRIHKGRNNNMSISIVADLPSTKVRLKMPKKPALDRADAGVLHLFWLPLTLHDRVCKAAQMATKAKAHETGCLMPKGGSPMFRSGGVGDCDRPRLDEPGPAQSTVYIPAILELSGVCAVRHQFSRRNAAGD